MPALRNHPAWILLLLLTGCAQFSHKEMPALTTLPATWQNSGKLAIKLHHVDPASNIKPHQILRFRWLQQDTQHFVIRLSGSFGMGAVTITKSPQQVTLARGAEVLSQAANVEALFYDHTGFPLPVSLLSAWITGQADPAWPSQPIDPTLSDANAGTPTESLLAGFKQQGWTVNYPKSSMLTHHPVPKKIVAEHHDMTITIIIGQWQFDDV